MFRIISRILLTFLCLSLFLSFLPSVFATTETRYFRSDQHTINGLTAYILGTAESNTLEEVSGCTVTESGNEFMLGIRVYIRHANGSETEITPGETVAIVDLTTGADYTTILSGAWNCSETMLENTDAIKIDVRYCCGQIWSESSASTIATFITEQLGASQLDDATWTVYYSIRRDRVTVGSPPWQITYWSYYFRFGTASDNSRIEGFSYTGGGGVTKEWHDITTWTFNVATRKWFDVASWNLNISAMQWNDIATWSFTVLTRIWHNIATYVFNLTVMAWHNLATWTFNVITKTWNAIAEWTWNLVTHGWHTISYWILTVSTTNIPILLMGIIFTASILFLVIGLGLKKGK